MYILIDSKSGVPIYDQIATQIKEQILDGSLPEGEALPSIRSLAKDLRISVITTKRAYEELEQEGFIDTMPGKGSYVAVQNRELMREEDLKKIEELMRQIHVLADRNGLTAADLQDMLELTKEEGMNALEIRGLTKEYKDFKLDSLDLTLTAGCILGLIGENGAGKTTTIKAVLDIVKADSGEVTLLGRSREEIASIKEDLGIVLGEPGLSGCLTASQVDRIMEGIFSSWNGDLFRSLADQLDLPMNKKFKELSQGNRMKLGIAVAMSHGAKLLLLDEPTNGLDPVARDKVMNLLMEFTRDEDHAVLISSHIVSDLEKVCDYIAFLHEGKLMLCEEKDRLVEEYGVLHCRREDLEAIDPAAVIGCTDSVYGVSAVVKRDAVPEGMPLSAVSLEDLFVVMVKGA